QNYSMLNKYLDEVLAKMGKTNPTLADFETFKPENENQGRAVKIVKSELKKEPDFAKFKKELDEALEYFDTQLKYHLNLDFDSRPTVGDNYENSSERHYGNNDVTGPDADHGTHVAGIIAAVRNNGIGIDGVATNVRIMSVRTVPDGDERDKDVANAIRYAVDNGARVINMSFGKPYAWDKAVVDSAVRYAMSKDVLLVHAAGNDGQNNDVEKNFPTKYYTDSAGLNIGQAPGWIDVGASGWNNDESLKADFSNYGKKTVDVFAPGVQINSTVPGSKYEENDGTSMASPVVAGLAALIRSYYPELNALQVKNIIMESVTKVNPRVKVSEGGSNKRVSFSDLSITGGVVNAYNALQLADKVAKGTAQVGK
ncbi:MAG TPA: S8 family peptidase, partial [Sphingobacteriaceae bacterium]